MASRKNKLSTIQKDVAKENNNSLSNHVALLKEVPEIYQGLALKMCKDLIKEYNCKKTSEVAVVHLAVSAYIRSIECSANFNFRQNCSFPRQVDHCKVLGAEIDRAHRQYLAAINALRRFNVPPIKINVKTKHAYIAQNQQINHNNEKVSSK